MKGMIVLFCQLGYQSINCVWGGGDSLFDALMHALSRIDQMRLVLPGNIHELRKYLMYHASNKPEIWGLKDKGQIKYLKRLAIPGTPVFQGVLLVVSQLFKVVVYV